MPSARAGHHGDAVFTFEDNGFDTAPSDTSFKNFGSNTRTTTYDAARQAERVFNADRKAAEIVGQNFEGGLEITCDLSEPPWWLAGIFGQPTSTLVSGSLYDYNYSLANGNDPVSLRVYFPTDGFADYDYVPGFVIADVTVNQSNDANPECVLNGFYAREPQSASSLSPSAPSLGESTYTNRDAELLVGGTSVGIVQDTTTTINSGNRPIQGFSQYPTDFVPGSWEPEVTWSKIIDTGQSVDPLSRFQDVSTATVEMNWDNGETGEDLYAVELDVTGAFPDEWTESGRNDPEANLTEELQEMGQDATALVSTDAGSSGNPPGITL